VLDAITHLEEREQLRPYVRAAIDQFSPKRRTVTQRLLERLPEKARLR
jgi:hypothetical protein